MIQGHVPARVWGFESPLRHQNEWGCGASSRVTEPEKARMALVKKCPLVDRVVLSGVKNHLPHIVKMRPDVIALGYDQSAYVSNLKKDLKNKGILVKITRLKPYKEKIYKNRLIKKIKII